MPENTYTEVTAPAIDGEAVISEIASKAVSEVMETASVNSDTDIFDSQTVIDNTTVDVSEDAAESTAETVIKVTEATQAIEATVQTTAAEEPESVYYLPPETTGVITEATTELTTETVRIAEVPTAAFDPASLFAPALVIVLAAAAYLAKKSSDRKKSSDKKPPVTGTQNALKPPNPRKERRKAHGINPKKRKETYQRKHLILFRTKKYYRKIYGISAKKCIQKPIPLTTLISILRTKNSNTHTLTATLNL